jgi:hypothetical protein
MTDRYPCGHKVTYWIWKPTGATGPTPHCYACGELARLRRVTTMRHPEHGPRFAAVQLEAWLHQPGMAVWERDPLGAE